MCTSLRQVYLVNSDSLIPQPRSALLKHVLDHKPRLLLQVQVTSSSSGRNRVKHLLDDVKRELVQAKIHVANGAKLGLRQLCLQCKEDISSSSLPVKVS